MARTKDDIAGMMAGAGLISSIFPALQKAVLERGGTAEDLHRLTKEEGRDIVGRMADVIVGHAIPPHGGKVIGQLRLSVVDHTASVGGKAEAGGYDYVNPNLTDAHFPHLREGRGEDG